MTSFLPVQATGSTWIKHDQTINSSTWPKWSPRSAKCNADQRPQRGAGSSPSSPPGEKHRDLRYLVSLSQTSLLKILVSNRIQIIPVRTQCGSWKELWNHAAVSPVFRDVDSEIIITHRKWGQPYHYPQNDCTSSSSKKSDMGEALSLECHSLSCIRCRST